MRVNSALGQVGPSQVGPGQVGLVPYQAWWESVKQKRVYSTKVGGWMSDIISIILCAAYSIFYTAPGTLFIS